MYKLAISCIEDLNNLSITANGSVYKFEVKTNFPIPDSIYIIVSEDGVDTKYSSRTGIEDIFKLFREDYDIDIRIAGQSNVNNDTDYIRDWDSYFMAMAELISLRSKDENTKVGAVIVSKDNKVRSIGYNGFPTGVDESKIPHGRDGDLLDTKYPFVVHSEANALMNGEHANYKGCKIYVTLFPCNECAKLIVQSGIAEVIYLSDKYDGTDMNKAAKMIFDLSGVKYTSIDYLLGKYKGLKGYVEEML